VKLSSLYTGNARYRWSVAFRAVAAIGGGYVLTSLLIIAGAIVLPFVGVGQAEATLATSLASFPIYAVIIMAVFQARNTLRAWLWVAGACVPPLLVYAAFQHGAAG
jgi:hypothetical protein